MDGRMDELLTSFKNIRTDLFCVVRFSHSPANGRGTEQINCSRRTMAGTMEENNKTRAEKEKGSEWVSE
jgi:hypothetical protein